MSHTVVFSVVIVAVPATVHVLACLLTPSPAFTFAIIVFIVTCVATFRSFLMCHWHPHRRVITAVSVSHCHVSPKFYATSGPHLVYFLPRL